MEAKHADITSIEYWDIEIKPHKSLLAIDWKAIWRFRDLMFLFVRRDFVSQFKQTILGPAWFFIQPVFTTIIFTVVFGNLAGISTDGIPKPVFYISGIILWNYFAECLNKTSTTFNTNKDLFGKVYFPRLIVPLSVIISNLMKLGVQFFLLAMIYIYFIWTGELSWPRGSIFLFPLLVLLVALLGLGLGLIVTSLTTKYRDLVFLVQFGVQLAMYASPIVYPLSIVGDDKKWMILLNPISAVIEVFRYSLFGSGFFDWMWIIYSIVATFLILLISILVFNRVEKSFIDTV